MSRGIALLFLGPQYEMGGGVQHNAPAACTPGKDPELIVQEVAWGSGPVWKGAENLVPSGIRSLDRPACSKSLYRLRYPARQEGLGQLKIPVTRDLRACSAVPQPSC